jgi:hypothetical protein
MLAVRLPFLEENRKSQEEELLDGVTRMHAMDEGICQGNENWELTMQQLPA